MRTKTEKNAPRRTQILEAADRVFRREGLAKASMRAIAMEAGCTTGAIYPLFEGKEDIYADILEQSLKRLNAAVATASAGEPDAETALISAAKAWANYYSAAPFEIDLGLYLNGNQDVRGLGYERDTMLNGLLETTLNIFRACFIRLAPTATGGIELEAWATKERDLLFASLTGIQILQSTGRAKSVGTNAEALLDTLVQTLQERIAQWRAPNATS